MERLARAVSSKTWKIVCALTFCEGVVGLFLWTSG
jgi:hypothetical protein